MTDTIMGSDGVLREMTPEEQAWYDAQRDTVAAEQSRGSAVTRFAVDEDAERLARVKERAETDPAFAALADLTLGKQGV